MMPTMKPDFTDAACSSMRIIWNPHGHVRRTGRDGTMPQERNVSGTGKGPVLIGGTTVSLTRMVSQEIVNPHWYTGYVEVGDTQIFDTSIDGNLANNGDSMTIFSKVIGRELSHDSRSYIYLRCRVDFTNNGVITEAPDLMHLGFPDVNASDELRSFGKPATIFRRPTDGYNWSAPGHVF